MTMMEWLKKSNTYIEVDSLGRQMIWMLGYLFFLHPNMTHHVSLKGTISEALNAVTIMKEEVEEIDPTATSFFASLRTKMKTNASQKWTKKTKWTMMTTTNS